MNGVRFVRLIADSNDRYLHVQRLLALDCCHSMLFRVNKLTVSPKKIVVSVIVIPIRCAVPGIYNLCVGN